MALSNDTPSMALFCDFENVALGVRDTHHEKFDIKLVLERLLLKGSIVVKKAYCDWERYRGFKAAMHEANFELIEIPHVRQSGKNSADIRLVVDALDLCYTKSHVDTFVIISGDSDFSPLVSKLRENNKQVIGVGVKQSTSDLLTANCDEFIFYDDLVREVARTTARRTPPPPPAPKGGNAEEDRKREETQKRRAKGVELAIETLEALVSERSDGSKIWSSVLKEAIKRRRPDFNESYFGFRGFSHLLEEAQARGLLELARDEKSNVYITRTAGAPTSLDAVAAPAPAAPEVLPVTHRVGDAEPRERGRKRGGRGRNAAERHDFEPVVAVGPATAEAPEELPAEEDEDDIAERFANAARDEQAALDAVFPEPVVVEPAPSAPEDRADEPSPREPGRRGARGGRGRDRTAANGKAPAAKAAAAPVAEVPVPAPAEAAAEPAAPPKPARKSGARKTAAGKTPRAPRKTPAKTGE
jgi:uncharacterized protein (TIGR00288 family)